MESLYTLSDLFILLLNSDLLTVKHFLLKQTQLKSVVFGELKSTQMIDTDSDSDSDTDIKDTKMDVIDTVKVLKCYSGIAT